MADPLSITISAVSLGVSAMTAWLTLFRRGTVKMTQPTVIYLGPDKSHIREEGPTFPKVYLRTLLFATSKRGRVIECMYVAISRNETRQNFNVWVYGDERLVRGSGLFVGETGVEANHHFLPPRDENSFRFVEGRYTLDVYARLLGQQRQIRLFSQSLDITAEIATALTKPHTGVYFDWGPDASRYLAHVETRPPSPDAAERFVGLLGQAFPRRFE
jgi:hypothetical protein